mmetsp:Transcript_20158/g.43787  ORF Transcript_20158/g.43787 Transcript_20158/m.43787 type:complete len:270 (-) Transcript_20158:120-929(-)|eukprot:CAMPEP_0172321024 /NCGR_PEP_ID=MMETSP1058-20130122/42025_1 /TAXON_ID=83371 /ORGANISM="Detonula confervacea, Strain CCMP 353" /LENGTH=269 /DNA_ID=CAMNT_0013036403 /DNA_START=57 /DNA_END=866 /DNA_ORIENTATION=+
MRGRIILSTPCRSASTHTSSIIQRHGPGDGVITLNVGGKTFQTLRSTIAQNEVLMDHVVRAETNMEMLGADNAIFIDRDPNHFGVILAYLRNKADGVYRYRHPGVAQRLLKIGNNNSSSSNDKCQSAKEITTQIADTMPTAAFIQLPKDSKTLTEMYYESVHYNIPELTNSICSQQSLARVFEIFGSKNPFQMATTAMTTGKVLFGGMVTVVTGMGGWMYAQAMAVQAKSNELLENNGGALVNQTGFWKKQTHFWNAIDDKWSGSTGDK